jgi:serine/threonine-protein kinase
MTLEDEQSETIDLPKEGDVLAGKYRIDRVLGKGGMGVVVAAHHTTLRQKVAVKFLLPAAAKRGDATERFLREARAAVSIQSEHVARVSDVGTLDTGAPFMVMEFLTGSDLGQALEERGPLPIAEAVDLVLQACEAIAEAHSLGLIHRDLKPANLFLTARADGSPLVKVLDFGLSKATKPDAMDASLTAAHVVMGSPYYMSPEQIRSFKNIDARADIWSIGVILYQLLTGRCPFDAESLGALFMAIGTDPVPSMREIRPEIPEALEAAVLKCLVKDAKARTRTISELARALAPFGAEDSHISVERISRVLSDPTPFARTPSRAPDAAPAPTAAASASPLEPSVSAVAAKTGPTSALAASAPATSVPAPAAPAPKSGRGALMGVAGVALVAIAIVAVRLLGGSTAGTPAQAIAPTTPLPGSAAPSLAPATTAQAAPSPPAPSVTVSAAATTAPSVSAVAPVPAPVSGPVGSAPAPVAGKGGPVAPKGSAAPKLSRPVSAALKHDEKFE